MLRPLQSHHIPNLHKMYSDVQTMRFMPSLPHADVPTTERELAQNMRHPDAHHWVVCLKGSDIDDLCAAYKAQGVVIRNEPESYPWGLREFTIEDNNGHLLRFGTHV